ncbi:MAG: sel1 repeat family protein [Gammaproteobacteria bacterium]|nr:MAG: sel1 repeat family protein [Gammaproteobacteria bacterium]
MVTDFPSLLKKAAAGEEAYMQQLIMCFAENILSKIEQEQTHLYLKKIGTHDAFYLRAIFYERGYGVKADAEMAFLLMREAAAKGSGKATYQVGHYYLEGKGIERNYANALMWLERAVGSPYYVAAAMYDLGRMYDNGWGVDKDPEQAKVWYEKAVEKGYRILI